MSARGWAIVTLLCLAAIASYLDRVIVGLLVTPITHDLSLSDTQFGALQGIAFGVFYTVLAFPIGRLVDHRRRTTIVAAGLAIFSVCSILSGLARSYGHLLIARIGVGSGEASLTPAAYSIIADTFPPERLGRANGIFTMSAFVGTGLAYVGGGAIVGLLERNGPVPAGPLGLLQPWQQTFFLTGLPGLLLVPVFAMLREPKRHGQVAGCVGSPGTLHEIRRLRRLLIPFFLGFALIALSSYSSNIWLPAVFIRAYGWSAAQIGLCYGLLYLVFGTAGSLFGGWLTDILSARGSRDAPLRVAAFGFLGVGLTGGLAPLMPNGVASLALLAPTVFLSCLPYPLAGTALQLIAPNRARGQITALYLTIVNLVGLVAGPVLVGHMSDVFGGGAHVRYPLAILNTVSAPAAFLCLLVSLAPLRALRLDTPPSTGATP